MQNVANFYEAKRVEEPLLNTLERVAALLKGKKNIQAFQRFVNFVAFLETDSPPQVIEEVYSCLEQLMDVSDSLQEIMPSIRKLLDISSDARYAEKQRLLAVKLAKWHFRQGKRHESERIQHFTNAIHYMERRFA